MVFEKHRTTERKPLDLRFYNIRKYAGYTVYILLKVLIVIKNHSSGDLSRYRYQTVIFIEFDVGALVEIGD